MKVTLKIESDYDLTPESFGNGNFTDNPAWDGVRVLIDRQESGVQGYQEFRYWQSEDLSAETRWYKKHGYSRHNAWLFPQQHARQQYKRHESFGHDWNYLYFQFTVTNNDGWEKSAAIGGVESDSGMDYFCDVVKELSEEMELSLCTQEITDLINDTGYAQ
jgi:hypothetical protein